MRPEGVQIVDLGFRKALSAQNVIPNTYLFRYVVYLPQVNQNDSPAPKLTPLVESDIDMSIKHINVLKASQCFTQQTATRQKLSELK